MIDARTSLRLLAAITALGGACAWALPVELKDGNGTRYKVNTQVDPLLSDSLASGALTNATYTAPTEVTEYFFFETFFGGISTATAKYQVDVPLTPAFVGFNGLLISGLGGQTLMDPLVFNPGLPLAGQDCPDSKGTAQELLFPSQTFPGTNLEVTRKVFVSHSKAYARWLNIVKNTGASDVQVGITLRGLIASANDTKIVATSNGGVLNNASLWFTSAQSVPQGEKSLEPRIGYVVQNAGASAPATSVGINSVGQAAFTYTPTIAPGATAIVMTFVTVQGKSSNAKSTCENLVTNPLPSDAIACMSEQDLAQVVNFPKITPPALKSATVKLNFKKTGQDTVQWKGKVTIGAGIALAGLPVSVDFGGVTQNFVLNKSGSANNGDGNKFSLSAKLQNGLTKAGDVNFSFNLKGDLQDTLAAYGLADASVSNVAVTIPVTFSVGTGGAGYGVNQAFTYTATQGKSGKAKAS